MPIMRRQKPTLCLRDSLLKSRVSFLGITYAKPEDIEVLTYFIPKNSTVDEKNGLTHEWKVIVESTKFKSYKCHFTDF